jgi:carboxymethylenebutenolidase
MSDLVTIKRSDGKDCPCYLATPSGSPKGGVVLIQEWWGLNPQIKRTGDRLAAEGYRTLVPDLYRGKLAKDGDEASHLMSSLDFGGAVEDIRAAKAYLGEAGLTVAAVGFCMGGALTLLSAMKVDGLAAGVCFYGITPAAAGDPGSIAVPLQCHFAQRDDWCTPEAVDKLEASLKRGGVPYELYRYDASHAFMNEARPEVYDAACATQAWQRTLAFLGEHIA